MSNAEDQDPKLKTFRRVRPEWDDKPTVKSFPAVTPADELASREEPPDLETLSKALSALMQVVVELGGNVDSVRALLKKK